MIEGNYWAKYAYPSANTEFDNIFGSNRIQNPATSPFDEHQRLNRLKRELQLQESVKKINWRKEGF